MDKFQFNTVLIDVDNTLLDFNKCAKQSMEMAFDELGFTFNDNVFTVFNATNNRLWKRYENGEIPKADIFGNRWNEIFAKLGIDYDGVEFEKKFVANLYDSAVPVDGAIELLKELSTKYLVYVVSNSEYEQQLNRLIRADMLQYLRRIFVSDDIGFQKPSMDFFSACFAELDNARKDEVILIGDSLSADIEGGHNFGITTIWYNHNKIDVPQDCVADHIVNNLTDILEIL